MVVINDLERIPLLIAGDEKGADEVATSHIEESKSSNARRQQEKDTKSIKQSDMMTLNTNVEQKTDATGKPENIQEVKVNFMITFLHTF